VTRPLSRWLRANATTYGVDSSRVAIGGASANPALAHNLKRQ
jgi:acetyl esterase/lipase